MDAHGTQGDDPRADAAQILDVDLDLQSRRPMKARDSRHEQAARADIDQPGGNAALGDPERRRPVDKEAVRPAPVADLALADDRDEALAESLGQLVRPAGRLIGLVGPVARA